MRSKTAQTMTAVFVLSSVSFQDQFPDLSTGLRSFTSEVIDRPFSRSKVFLTSGLHFCLIVTLFDL